MKTKEIYQLWLQDPLRYEAQIKADTEQPTRIPSGLHGDELMRYLQLMALQAQVKAKLCELKLAHSHNKAEKHYQRVFVFKMGEA